MEKELPDIVLIHDGARPSVTDEIIVNVFKKAETDDAAAPLIPLVDTIKETDKDGVIVSHPDRNSYGEFRRLRASVTEGYLMLTGRRHQTAEFILMTLKYFPGMKGMSILCREVRTTEK